MRVLVENITTEEMEETYAKKVCCSVCGLGLYPYQGEEETVVCSVCQEKLQREEN